MSNILTFENFLPTLQKDIPGFSPDPEWLSDGEYGPNLYLIGSDFARHICEEARWMNDLGEARLMIDLSASVSFLEKALIDGDDDVRDLLIDIFETLTESPHVNLIRPLLGHNSQIWLDWVEECNCKGSGAGPRPEIQQVKTSE